MTAFFGVEVMIPYQRRKPEVTEGLSLLIKAAKEGKREDVASLLNTEDPDERDVNGATPPRAHSMHGDLSSCRLDRAALGGEPGAQRGRGAADSIGALRPEGRRQEHASHEGNLSPSAPRL